MTISTNVFPGTDASWMHVGHTYPKMYEKNIVVL